jgi:hypothetical protein
VSVSVCHAQDVTRLGAFAWWRMSNDRNRPRGWMGGYRGCISRVLNNLGGRGPILADRGAATDLLRYAQSRSERNSPGFFKTVGSRSHCSGSPIPSPTGRSYIDRYRYTVFTFDRFWGRYQHRLSEQTGKKGKLGRERATSRPGFKSSSPVTCEMTAWPLRSSPGVEERAAIADPSRVGL